MGNIFLLPTDKPTRLHFDGKLFLSPNYQYSKIINSIVEGRNICITSDEEIKEGDWVTDCVFDIMKIVFEEDGDLTGWKKIILTTDQDLIADGVQAIDNEFLEWFLNNPNREEVEVKIKTKWKTTVYDQPDMEDVGYTYKINIPQEESKEECCESANGFYLGTTCPKCNQPFRSVIEKPKQELQIYSEEDMNEFAWYFHTHLHQFTDDQQALDKGMYLKMWLKNKNK
jgi:hypothetical protein